mmetsp:Transcript_16949/g.38900  ORF Transcript_16949/g.38900 Transcript_16949/m.38900 type:complete len:215 (-) Transcript_16949:1267-1911(-)
MEHRRGRQIQERQQILHTDLQQDFRGRTLRLHQGFVRCPAQRRRRWSTGARSHASIPQAQGGRSSAIGQSDCSMRCRYQQHPRRSHDRARNPSLQHPRSECQRGEGTRALWTPAGKPTRHRRHQSHDGARKTGPATGTRRKGQGHVWWPRNQGENAGRGGTRAHRSVHRRGCARTGNESGGIRSRFVGPIGHEASREPQAGRQHHIGGRKRGLH